MTRRVIMEDDETRLAETEDGHFRLYEREKDPFGTLYWSRVTDDEAAFDILAQLVRRRSLEQNADVVDEMRERFGANRA